MTSDQAAQLLTQNATTNQLLTQLQQSQQVCNTLLYGGFFLGLTILVFAVCAALRRDPR